jgi:hypothetical protein
MTNKVEELILEVAKEIDGKNGMRLIDNQFVEHTDENNYKTITPLLVLVPMVMIALKDHPDDMVGMKDFIKRLFYNKE